MIPPGSLGNPLSVQTACWLWEGVRGRAQRLPRLQERGSRQTATGNVAVPQEPFWE